MCVTTGSPMAILMILPLRPHCNLQEPTYYHVSQYLITSIHLFPSVDRVPWEVLGKLKIKNEVK